MAAQRVYPRVEPAHSLLYNPASLPPTAGRGQPAEVLAAIAPSLKHPLNARQQEAFSRGFTDRVALLWGPPLNAGGRGSGPKSGDFPGMA